MTRTLVGALAGALVFGSVCPAAEPPPLDLSGSIAGLVSDSAGLPRMGATVLLYNRFDRLVEKSITTDKGTFGFSSLAPDVYAVRVSLASFLPALKRNIVVQPGMQSLLAVNLTSVFSSVELVALAPGQTALMSDEWKWVLRSAHSIRPVLRYLPDLDVKAKRQVRSRAQVTSTRGLVKVSAGDQAAYSALGNEPDLGTAFALATSFPGRTELQVSGNVAYAPTSGAPAAGFRTSFRRDNPGGNSPEVKVTMRQVFLPARAGAAVFAGLNEHAPVLRSVAATFLNEQRLTDSARLEYGSSMDLVSFLDTLNYFSPYARLTIDSSDEDTLQFAFASGTPPAELFMNEGGTALELQQDLAALALFPRVSLSGGRVKVQRTQSLEAGYRKRIGSRTYSFALYRETVRNAALTAVGFEGIEPGSDVLPDLFSRSWVINGGRYSGTGYLASATQSLGPHLDVSMAYGSGGALTLQREIAREMFFEDLQQALRTTRRHSLTMRVSGTAPRAATQFATSYQWANVLSLTPQHMYLTQRIREGLGLNVSVRQPLPQLGLWPGRIEATADLRNLLAQGYMPLTAENRRIVLMHTPRTVRGGLSFIF